MEGESVAIKGIPCLGGRTHRVKDGQSHCWVCGVVFTDFGKPKKTYRSSETGAKRFAIAARDGALCYYCGHELILDFKSDSKGGSLPKWAATVDHKIPRCYDGSNSLDNLVLACQPCNQAKGDLTAEKWRALGFPKRRALKQGFVPPVDRT